MPTKELAINLFEETARERDRLCKKLRVVQARNVQLERLLHEALTWIENSSEPAVSLCTDIRNALK